MPQTAVLDPLGTSADPRRYIPIGSSERALAALDACLDEGRSPILLLGQSGVGKTLLLRVLEARELSRGRSVVFSPFLHLPPRDIAPWLLHLLGDPPGKGSPEEQLLAAISDRGAGSLLVIVDEIHSATAASAGRLAQLAAAAGRRLSLVMAAQLGPELEKVMPALNPAVTISLPDPLPEHEMTELLDALLSHLGPDPLVRQNGAGQREIMLQLAHGIPALLKLDLIRRVANLQLPRRAIPEAPADRSDVQEEIPPPTIAPPLPVAQRDAVTALAVVAGAAPSGIRARSVAQHIAATVRREGIEARRLVKGALEQTASAISVARASLARRGSLTVSASNAALREAAGSARNAVGPLARSASLAVKRARADFTPAAQRALAAGADSARRLRSRVATPLSSAASRVKRTPRSLRRAVLEVSLLLLLIAWVGGGAPGAPPEKPVLAGAPVRVQVNAFPWALIRVDGVLVGPTPLSHLHLTPGPHEFEAEFPDGRVLRRRVEIGAEHSTVSLR